MNSTNIGRVAGAVAWLAVALTGGTLVLALSAGSHPVPDGIANQALDVFLTVAFLPVPVLGAIVVANRVRNPFGWILCVAGLATAFSGFAIAYAFRATVAAPGSLPGGELMAWLGAWTWVPSIPLLGTFGLLLFPDGRLPSRRWRPVAWLSVAMLAAIALSCALRPGPLEDFAALENPYAPSGAVGAVAAGLDAAFALLPLSVVASAASLLVRARRAEGADRAQIRSVALAAPLLGGSVALCGILALVLGDPSLSRLPEGMAILGVAAAAAVAIQRHRLYDIDVIVNRTLLYGGLTASVAGIYIVAVTALGALLGQPVRLAPALLGTGIVAIVVQPLRNALQRWLDRAMHGDRHDPYRAVSRLGERLQSNVDPEAVLSTVVETVAEALRLPFVAIELRRGGDFEVVASHGAERRGEPQRLPLIYRGEAVGRLAVRPRPGEDLTGADRRVLEGLAQQAGVAVHAVRLTADLQSSRERLVTAGAEERRRLRRDLHDGLGPALAGIALKLDAVRNVLARDGRGADEMLADARDQAQEATADVRRLVDGLRPPALDELGLAAALRAHAERFGAAANGDRAAAATLPRVSVRVPDRLPVLPAAVEVAAYRIALEGLTNASRHAHAREVRLNLELDGALELEVTDDGRGIPTGREAGVGLASMRERASELGGTLTVEPRPNGGTTVRARLPVSVA